MFQKYMVDFFEKYPCLRVLSEDISSAFSAMVACYEKNGKILVCGNGGSAADSEHIVGELMKGFNRRRPLQAQQRKLFSGSENGERIADSLQNALPAISLVSQCGLITAFANDADPELIFAQQVWGYGKENDLLIALSTSGNSKNIALAAETAKAMGIRVLAITGEKESRLSALADICISLPAFTPKDVQELTLPVYHVLCEAVEAHFFPD